MMQNSSIEQRKQECEESYIPEYIDCDGWFTEVFGKQYRAPVVYTFYDIDLQPLYVGKTISFVDRYCYHSKQKTKNEPWMNDTRYIGTIYFDNLDDMDIAEVIEIHKKRPKYNKDCNKNRCSYIFGHFTQQKQIAIATCYQEDIFSIEDFETLFNKA